MEEIKKWPPSKEEFEELYVKQNLKAKDIASMFGVKAGKIHQFASNTGIKKPAGYHFQPEPKKGVLDGVTDEELKMLYIEQNLAADEIADLFGVARSLVYTVLSRRGIHKPKELFIQKQKERNLKKYGATTTLKLKSVQDKISEICLEKYGTSSVASVGGKKVHEKLKENPPTEEEKKAICDKRKETLQKQYGVDRVCDIPGLRDKIEQTNLEKYGCKNPMQNKRVRERLKQSNLEKFGVENAMQSLEIKQKVFETLQGTEKVCTSKQQKSIFKALKQEYGDANVILNKLLKNVFLDIEIRINDVSIDVEYDGWYWHRDKENEDRRRNYAVISEGYKVLRIKAARDIPTNEELFNAINFLVYNKCSFKEIKLPDWDEQEQKYQNKLKEKSSDAH